MAIWEVRLSKIVLPFLIVSLPRIAIIECYKNGKQYHLNISGQAFNSFQHFREFSNKITPRDPVTKEVMYEFSFGPDVVTFTVKLRVIVHFIGCIKNVLALSDIHYFSDHSYTS